MTEEEGQQALAQGMRDGIVIAALVDGEVKFYHKIHAGNIPTGARRLSVAEVAQKNGWDWWFQQN